VTHCSNITTIVDVVARRRLRASCAQIEQATKFARSRRKEFENIVARNMDSINEDRMAKQAQRESRSSRPSSVSRTPRYIIAAIHVHL
jgi:hypothetical protein